MFETITNLRRVKLTIEPAPESAIKISCINDVSKYIREIPEFKEYLNSQEVFIGLYLNNYNKILGYQIIGLGSDIGVVVDPKIICAAAILSLSKRVIVAHNHPSGNLEASKNDYLVTKSIKHALGLFEITLLDSFIITNDSQHSIIDEA
jgi:DNA repair protein RadC